MLKCSLATKNDIKATTELYEAKDLLEQVFELADKVNYCIRI